MVLALLVLATLATTVAKAKRSPEAGPAAAGALRGYRSLLHRLDPGGGAGIRGLIRRSALDAAGASTESHLDGILFPAGDLDGDGLGDAFEVSEERMTAVRGTDGVTLWTRTFQGWGFPVAQSQLNRTGGLDVLVLEEDWSGTEAGFRVTVRVSALVGGSGAELWTRSFEGNGTYGEIGGYGYGSGGVEGYAEAAFPVLAGVGDATGDGGTDLLMGLYSYVETPDQANASATFNVISGADGIPGPPFAAAGRFGWPDASLVSDLSGDGRADVVTKSSFRATGQEPAADTRLTAFPGMGGPQLWQTNLSIQGATYVHGIRLDGDARTDLMLTIDTDTTRLMALSGASGSSLWSRQLDQYAWYFPIPAGDIGGDGGQEVLVLTEGGFPFYGQAASVPQAATLGIPALPGHTGSSDPCYGCEPCGPDPCPPPKATMLRGADGAVLWEVPVGDDEYHMPAGDVTGDGIHDVLMVGPGTGSNNVAGRLFSGRTGTQAWTKASTWDDLFPLFGDLDADGAQDLILVDYRSSGDRYVALRGTNAQNLWTANRTPGGDLIATLPGSLGTDGADVLETAFGSNGVRLAAVNGVNGAQLWRRS